MKGYFTCYYIVWSSMDRATQSTIIIIIVIILLRIAKCDCFYLFCLYEWNFIVRRLICNVWNDEEFHIFIWLAEFTIKFTSLSPKRVVFCFCSIFTRKKTGEMKPVHEILWSDQQGVHCVNSILILIQIFHGNNLEGNGPFGDVSNGFIRFAHNSDASVCIWCKLVMPMMTVLWWKCRFSPMHLPKRTHELLIDAYFVLFYVLITVSNVFQ